MYAWTTFRTEFNEYGQATKTIKPGDEVSQSDLDVSDEEWADLQATGAVREEEYPDIPADVSPAEYLRQKVAEGDADEDELSLFGDLMTKSGTAETDAKQRIDAGVAPPNAEAGEEGSFDEYDTSDQSEKEESSTEKGGSASATKAAGVSKSPDTSASGSTSSSGSSSSSGS